MEKLFCVDHGKWQTNHGLKADRPHPRLSAVRGRTDGRMLPSILSPSFVVDKSHGKIMEFDFRKPVGTLILKLNHVAFCRLLTSHKVLCTFGTSTAL